MERTRGFLAPAAFSSVLACLLSLALLLRTPLALVSPCRARSQRDGRRTPTRPGQEGLWIEARRCHGPGKPAQPWDARQKSSATSECAHHLAHLSEALDQLHHLLAASTAAAGDPGGAALLDRLGLRALARGHGADHRLHPHEFALVELVC